ncbi:MAG: 3,4-dehydroadipyl-CoA semialdehyde dehydrogenase [Deltaproteobacteria bacterium]|nr:3,4-dehydroadipyl-CoA semialdehyde dehydrogenase [Deltaproteobacteria bacterium]
MDILESYLCGEWVRGHGKTAALVDPSTEETVAHASTEGLDLAAARTYAIDKGGPALRAMSFAQRGELLLTLSRAVHAKRDELIEYGMKNAGNTRSDAKFDVDGASSTLAFYGELGRTLGDGNFFADGDAIPLGRSSRVSGQHVLTARRGVALHINAFNFPAWGLAEKAACAWLAGVPVMSKPATATCLMTVHLVKAMVETGALGDGVLQLITGSTGTLVEQLGPQDVLAFTGSGNTGATLRASKSVLTNSVRVNVEADSLNCAILGRDVERGSETYQLFVADAARDITQKSGQKCTAIRRIFVPAERVDEVCEDIMERLSAAVVGSPFAEGVTVGPVATASQLRDVREGIAVLERSGAKVLCGGAGAIAGKGAPEGKGYFVAPTLMLAADAHKADAVHAHEVFGPVSTVLAYRSDEECVALVARAGGGLVSTLYTDDRAITVSIGLGIAAYHGRVCVANGRMGSGWLGPGTVLPGLLHGGPGRAGGGEELGGMRGLNAYLQRTALQGFGPLIEHAVAGAKRLPAL